MSSLALFRAGEFGLESSETLRDVRVSYHLEGKVSPDGGNVVLLFHALTGSPADFGGWEGLVGPGRPLDTRHFAVLCPNHPGSCYGTTFRREKGRGREPLSLTTRDMARLAGRLVTALGGRRVALVAGGSLGGMVALEWAATFPQITDAVAAFASPASAPAWAAGWNHLQRELLKSGRRGMALARAAGMLSYRTQDEFESRFRVDGASNPSDQPVRRYLEHHGEKLVNRFSAKSYLLLLDSMDSHNVGRGRGSVASALRAYRGRLVGVGIPGDVLYPPQEIRRWTVPAKAEYRDVESVHGHDGFLLEQQAVGELLASLLPARGERFGPARSRGGRPSLVRTVPPFRALTGGTI